MQNFLTFLGEKSYNRKLKEDRHKGYDPRPEALRPTVEKIQEDIQDFLIKCHDKLITEKKTGKRIHSNFYCLYATMKLDGEEDELELPVVLSPIEQKMKENWDLIESKYKDFILDPLDQGDVKQAELLEEIKVLFMENLCESLNRFSNDPLSTDMGAHVTGSEPQSASKSWKKERYPL
jgi:hypothetical protein